MKATAPLLGGRGERRPRPSGRALRATAIVVAAMLSLVLCIGLMSISTAYGVAAALIVLLVTLRIRLRTLALLLVFASMVAPGLGDALHIGALTYLDEATSIFVGVLVPLWLRLTGKKFVMLPGQWFLVLALVLGLISSALSGVSSASSAQGAFLLVKMPLLAFGFAQLGWEPEDIPRIARAVVQFVIPLVGLSVLANVVLGRDWVNMMSGGLGGYIDYRYGLLSSQGLFTHPLILGNVAAVLGIGAFATMMHLPQIRFARAATTIAVLAGLASFRRTAMLGLASAFFIAWPRRARRTLVIGLCLLVPVVCAGLASDIQTTVDSTLDEYVYTAAPAPRTRLLFGAFQVAAEHAPFGAGFARYGSYLAGVDYSPEYVRLGFENVWGLSDLPGMSGAFLTDTQWPVLIGETGWVGFAAFVTFLVLAFRVFVRAGRHPDDHLAWVSTFGRGAFVVAAVASIGVPVFTSTPVSSILFALVGLGVSAVHRAETAAGSANAPLTSLVGLRGAQIGSAHR